MLQKTRTIYISTHQPVTRGTITDSDIVRVGDLFEAHQDNWLVVVRRASRGERSALSGIAGEHLPPGAYDMSTQYRVKIEPASWTVGQQ